MYIEFVIVVVVGVGFYGVLVLFFIDVIVFFDNEVVFNVWLILRGNIYGIFNIKN